MARYQYETSPRKLEPDFIPNRISKKSQDLQRERELKEKIKQEAKCKLGMQKLTNDQKIYISLPKKDYVQSSNNSTETTTEKSWFEKIIDKIKGN